MYIDEAISICDKLYPNPYELREKYFWCDDLSSMLALKYNKQYIREELTENDNTYLLPEGVTLSHIDRVIYGNKEILKQDMRSYGLIYIADNPRGRLVFSNDSRPYKRLYIIYLKPYEKIRSIDLKDETVSFFDGGFKIAKDIFKAGDILKITYNGQVYDNIPVFEIEADEDISYTRIITNDHGIQAGEKTVDISRYVTEETICQAPHDSMYVDYLNGKICYYQRDFESYNQHMMLFNAKLIDYERWLKQNDLRVSVAKTINWW